jgi:3-hydroxyisobutyrate dehydrogenase-like beta-hydroxyacid dehydrogenase
MARLGFVGVGTMGTPMAGHVLSAGHELRVHDLSAERVAALVDKGAVDAGSVAGTAEGVEAVFLSLPGPPDVEAAVAGPGGLLGVLAEGSVVIDLSTNSIETVRSLRERAAARGVVFVDAPVSGGVLGAKEGTLAVMVGAEPDEFERVEPLLSCFGKAVIHVGACGSGTVAKLVNNQLFLAASVLVQEAFVTAAAAGVDPSDLQEILLASSSAPYAALVPFVMSRRFDDVVFRLDIAAKDMRLAVGSAEAAGVQVPTTRAALGVYEDAVAAGMGADVFHSTLRQLEAAAGLEVPRYRRKDKDRPPA